MCPCEVLHPSLSQRKKEIMRREQLIKRETAEDNNSKEIKQWMGFLIGWVFTYFSTNESRHFPVDICMPKLVTVWLMVNIKTLNSSIAHGQFHILCAFVLDRPYACVSMCDYPKPTSIMNMHLVIYSIGDVKC